MGYTHTTYVHSGRKSGGWRQTKTNIFHLVDSCIGAKDYENLIKKFFFSSQKRHFQIVSHFCFEKFYLNKVCLLFARHLDHAKRRRRIEEKWQNWWPNAMIMLFALNYFKLWDWQLSGSLWELNEREKKPSLANITFEKQIVRPLVWGGSEFFLCFIFSTSFFGLCIA